jgi:prepilin-type N-terminal cleavage/methylation domain-containing protein
MKRQRARLTASRCSIGRTVRNQGGFTLVELLLVVAILGVLAAVVSISVVGLIGRGEEETYETDERTIQLAVSTFYSDVHGYDAGGGGWNAPGNVTSVHNFPTRQGAASGLDIADETTYVNGYHVWEIVGYSGSTPAEKRAEIEDAAIWMGLLTNGPGQGSGGVDVAPGDDNSPMDGEHGPYLNPLPQSCSTTNASRGAGTITWIVGDYGRVYGVWEQDGVWYAGFRGRYP